MFLIVWEYQVKSGHEEEFEDAYGPNGLWVQLFRKSDGYHSTELLHDSKNRNRYLTIDRWDSEKSYQSFLRDYKAEYDGIDKQCNELTESEARVGTFAEK